VDGAESWFVMTCPQCHEAMTPGSISIRGSMTGTALEFIGMLAAGMGVIPQGLYFYPDEGGEVRLEPLQSFRRPRCNVVLFNAEPEHVWYDWPNMRAYRANQSHAKDDPDRFSRELSDSK
jgi:hypothetical protein